MNDLKTTIEELNYMPYSSYHEQLKPNVPDGSSLLLNTEILKMIFNNAPIGIALIDENGKILSVNTEILNMFGYSKEEALTSTVDKFIHPDDYKKDQKLLEEVLSGKTDYYSVEKKYLNKNGDTLFGRLTLFCLDHQYNENAKLIAFVENLTNRKQADKKLFEEQSLLSALLHNTSDNIYFKDLHGRFIKVNEATAKKLGFLKPEELIGKTDFDIFAEAHAVDAYRDEQEIIKTFKALIDKEEKEEWPDGRISWAGTSKIPYFDEDGNLKGIIGITRDITEKKKAELIREVLYEISEAAYSASDLEKLFSIIHKAIQRLLPANNFYIALYDEMKGILSFPYFVDEYDSAPASRKIGKGLTEYVLLTGEALLVDEKLDKKLKEKDEIELVGSPSPIWLGVPLKMKNKSIGVIVVQDYKNAKAYGKDEMQLLIYISEQIARAIENIINSDKIKKYMKELVEINRTKDKFFSIIAHDLKSPFNGLLGLIELLTEPDHNLTPAEREEYTNDLSTLLKNQYELLQNLLEWATMQLGKTAFEPVQLNLYLIAKKKIELFRENAHKKNITLLNEIGKITCAIGDTHMVGSILQNFISNALKFTRRNGLIKIYSQVENGFVKVTIEDNGIGIEKKSLENIFRLDSIHTSKGTEGELGTGLGVMLCREMIEKQGGKIYISSEVNVGTKVSFTLPAVPEIHELLSFPA